MERKGSMNSFTNPGADRTRLYSWSRPSHRRPRKHQAKAQLCIKGSATLAFSPDGEWFQGNIISSTQEAYTISGKCRQRSFSQCRDSVTEQSSPRSKSISTSESHSSPYSRSFDLSSIASSPMSVGTQQSSDLYQDSPSDKDSIDAELVRVAIENFLLEEEEYDASYDVSIYDYETGVNHSIKNVSSQVFSKECRLTSDQVNFTSSSVSRGTKADMVIQENLGQALTGQNLIVFQGQLEFSYNDLVCFPIAQGEERGQWCL